MSWSSGAKRSWAGNDGGSWKDQGSGSWDSKRGGGSWSSGNDWKSKWPRSDGYDWANGKDRDSRGKGSSKGSESLTKDGLDADLDAYFGRSVKDGSKQALDGQLDEYFTRGSKEDGEQGSGEAPATSAAAPKPTDGSKEALDDQLDGYFTKKAAEQVDGEPTANEATTEASAA
mmetsp:Transcript_9481/g.19146  ORF Transcript_9481/g.19146 Transcript_9481/m.19146 type:complete len:173 (-) Transcript_9481:150-668(-)|eukprot:CAMPEP_0113824206 /NCGR_PEP_ID=MMETSP0328-20130328/3127_1 /TAXON_ID=39455 /ORGANISM="Alexandrium minutum" /LENGTH=172 /DNA_ID=CAMNT_0000792147 /DNA_START=15 /DNA_END=533 /DNA_ORIENTATION=- /assembly_acc=CAM_ASM_000350